MSSEVFFFFPNICVNLWSAQLADSRALITIPTDDASVEPYPSPSFSPTQKQGHKHTGRPNSIRHPTCNAVCTGHGPSIVYRTTLTNTLCECGRMPIWVFPWGLKSLCTPYFNKNFSAVVNPKQSDEYNYEYLVVLIRQHVEQESDHLLGKLVLYCPEQQLL